MIFAVVTNPCVGLTTVCIVQFVFMKLALGLLRFVYLYFAIVDFELCYMCTVVMVAIRLVLYVYINQSMFDILT